MAWYHIYTNLCFIHIPKTGGTWVKKVMGEVGTLGRSGNSHTLPDKYHREYKFFTIVRDPAEWLRSAWNHRVSCGWAAHPYEGPWNDFCLMTDEYKSDDFKEFAETVAVKLPGVVGWLFGCYVTPEVKWMRIEEAYEFLEYHGCDPVSVTPFAVSKGLPKILPITRQLIYQAEIETCKRFNFPPF